MPVKGAHVLAAVAVLAAGGLAYAAVRSTGPVPMPFTETNPGGFGLPVAYPVSVAPNASYTIATGFTSGRPCDGQAAALPAEKMW